MTADMRTLIRSEVERVLFAYDVLPEGDDTIIIAATSLDDLTGELTPVDRPDPGKGHP